MLPMLRRECPPWCSIVGATVTVHQFFCILHYDNLLHNAILSQIFPKQPGAALKSVPVSPVLSTVCTWTHSVRTLSSGYVKVTPFHTSLPLSLWRRLSLFPVTTTIVSGTCTYMPQRDVGRASDLRSRIWWFKPQWWQKVSWFYIYWPLT